MSGRTDDNEELWFKERLYPDISLALRIRNVIVPPYHTGFQELAIYDTFSLGRMFVLDNIIQLSEKDEAQYHEMMAHWPLYAHPCPKNVLIIGGGDGGVAREVLKHPSVESLTVVDIDPEVTKQTVEHMPRLGDGFHRHPKVRLLHEDALRFIVGKDSAYDVIILDITDDTGAATSLFGAEFILKIRNALTAQGVMLFCVGGSVFLQGEELQRNFQKCASVYGRENVKVIFMGLASYHGGYFGSIAAFKDEHGYESGLANVSENFKRRFIDGLKWYSPEMHRSVMLGAPSIEKMFCDTENLPETDS